MICQWEDIRNILPTFSNIMISDQVQSSMKADGENGKKVIAKVYVDGANVFYAQKKLGWSLDWRKVKSFLETDREIIEWRYYVAQKDGDEKMGEYLQYLNSIGFSAFTKSLKKIFVGDGSHQPDVMYKANFDVEITTDMLLDKAKTNEVILFSGDSDFAYVVKKLRDSGKRVSVFAFRKTLAWELKLAATSVYNINTMRSLLEREQKPPQR